MAAQAYRYGVELGRASESGAGWEASAKAAFGLGLILSRTVDLDEAAQAYRTSMELARLSNTAEGLEAGQKAAYNLKLLPTGEIRDE